MEILQEASVALPSLGPREAIKSLAIASGCRDGWQEAFALLQEIQSRLEEAALFPIGGVASGPANQVGNKDVPACLL